MPTTKPEHELVLPDLDNLDGAAGVNWKLVVGGTVIGGIGLALVAIAAAFTIAAVVAALAGAGPASVGLLVVGAIFLAIGVWRNGFN